LQLFQCQRFRGPLDRRSCKLTHLPITINDEPSFQYRGVMIDTARHYLPFHMILETIDALMYNKLNVLHWHITDEDSFPLVLRRHPEIAEYASFEEGSVYTVDQAKEVVRYAMVRGVRVVPELDSPGHAASWGRAPANHEVACSPGHYMGPLDVTLESTYTLVKEVFAEIMEIFPDPVLHLGGDEVALRCLVNKTQLMASEREQLKSGTPAEFELYYRRRQHKIIKELDPKKTPIYWINNGNIQLEPNDMIHWWGGTAIPRTDHKIVASFYGQYYLDLGVGNYLGSPYGSYSTWMDFFNQNSLKRLISNSPAKENVIGGVVCLWSEMSNRYTHHPKIWIRSSAFAERMWNPSDENKVKPEGLRRVTAHERLMNRRGIPTAPATCQQCEFAPQFC
jgi:hexosaminidase